MMVLLLLACGRGGFAISEGSPGLVADPPDLALDSGQDQGCSDWTDGAMFRFVFGQGREMDVWGTFLLPTRRLNTTAACWSPSVRSSSIAVTGIQCSSASSLDQARSGLPIVIWSPSRSTSRSSSQPCEVMITWAVPPSSEPHARGAQGQRAGVSGGEQQVPHRAEPTAPRYDVPMWTLLTLAHAGPNTAMVGFDADPERLLEVPTISTRCFRRARFCVMEFDRAPPIDTLAAIEGVRYAERDVLLDGVSAYEDADGTTDCPEVWDLDAISAPAVWEAGVVDGPVIAVADGGFLTSHEELVDRISGQYDYGDGDPVANLEWDVGVPAHGTFIASIIAANPDNGRGRAGVMPEGRVNLLKIADSSGSFYYSYAASALADVADGDLGIRAVNYSIASSSATDSFRDAVLALDEVGVLLVAAAGNCGSDSCWDADNDAHPLYPANYGYDHVITVAGSVEGGGFNTWSHYGASTVDLAAPGVDICAAGVLSDDSYYSAAGTSYAAPIVAAAIGLLDTAHPELTTTEVGRVLRASAVDHDDWADKTRSGGVLDVERAIATAVPRFTTPEDVTVDQAGDLELVFRNVGAAGQGTFLLFHGGEVELGGEPFAAGDVLDLPDAGAWTATAPGTRIDVAVDAHEAGFHGVEVLGGELGTWPVTARWVVASDGADYLNAPYSGGDPDPTGFLAYSFEAEVTAVFPTDSGTDSPTESPTDSPMDSEPSERRPPGEKPPAGCGCGSTSAGHGWVLVLGFFLVARRVGMPA
ncbi:MAG: S8 family serine peptidase [Proteobacteria bacterium]|nr:S8 family serine peptidase [Pseudomonadota bacterium]